PFREIFCRTDDDGGQLIFGRQVIFQSGLGNVVSFPDLDHVAVRMLHMRPDGAILLRNLYRKIFRRDNYQPGVQDRCDEGAKFKFDGIIPVGVMHRELFLNAVSWFKSWHGNRGFLQCQLRLNGLPVGFDGAQLQQISASWDRYFAKARNSVLVQQSCDAMGVDRYRIISTYVNDLVVEKRD